MHKLRRKEGGMKKEHELCKFLESIEVYMYIHVLLYIRHFYDKCNISLILNIVHSFPEAYIIKRR